MDSLHHTAQPLVSAPDDAFRSFADAMPCVVFTARPDGSLDYGNARWREVTGSEVNQKPDGWLASVHADDREQFRETWNKGINAGQDFHLEVRIGSQLAGEYRWQKVEVRPQRDAAGRIQRWVGICQDIHEQRMAEVALRESQARLHSVVEGSPVGIVILNPSGQPTYFNRKCAELRGQEVDTLAWANALHPEDRERILASSVQAVERGTPWSAVYRYIHPDGRTVWVSARTVPIDADAERLGFVRTLEDITELKTVEEEMRKANQELRLHSGRLEQEVEERTAKVREALAELDKLSYSIVHDMRAPLRAMQGFADLLVEEYAGRLDDRGKEFLQRIASAAQRQDRLIQDVLAYHSYVREDFPLAPVSLDQVVSNIIETYVNFQPPRVRIEVLKPLGWALAHETLLTQCISALLDNATKFVAAGVKPNVVVRVDKGPHEVKLWVEDNGIGIAPEYRKKIFDIFYTFHLHEKQSGTGIGLPLAKKALERMQGSIGMESEVGQGSRFWLALKPIPAGAS